MGAIKVNGVAPCLWFDGQAEEAARFYVAAFGAGSIDQLWRAPADYQAGKAGAVFFVEFTVAGQKMQALNGGAGFAFSQAVSMSVSCEDQAGLDTLWAALIADGGEAVACGWLKDRYGLSWQLVPAPMGRWMGGDKAAAARVFKALGQMVKLDFAALEAAYKG